jgi:hypothetical protein
MGMFVNKVVFRNEVLYSWASLLSHLAQNVPQVYSESRLELRKPAGRCATLATW